jgi:hypothetical protein
MESPRQKHQNSRRRDRYRPVNSQGQADCLEGARSQQSQLLPGLRERLLAENVPSSVPELREKAKNATGESREKPRKAGIGN